MTRRGPELLAGLCLLAWAFALFGTESYGPMVHFLPVVAGVLLLVIRNPLPSRTSYQRWLAKGRVRR